MGNMQVINSNNYQSIPNTDSDFEEVVLDISDDIQEMAIGLFGNLQTEVDKKNKNYEKKAYRACLFFGLTFGSITIPTIIASAWYTAAGFVSLGSAGLYAPSIVYSYYYFKCAEKAKAYLDKFEAIKILYECFEDFKSEPQEVKVKKYLIVLIL